MRSSAGGALAPKISIWFKCMLIFPFDNNKEAEVIVYSCMPIDHHWEFLRTVKETAAELGAMEAQLRFEARFAAAVSRYFR